MSQDLLQWGHWYGFSAGAEDVLFSWDTRWLARWDFMSKLRGQYGHLNVPSSLGSSLLDDSLGLDPGMEGRGGEGREGEAIELHAICTLHTAYIPCIWLHTNQCVTVECAIIIHIWLPQ